MRNKVSKTTTNKRNPKLGGHRGTDANRSSEGVSVGKNSGPLLKFERLSDTQYCFSDEERYLFRMISQNKVHELKDFLEKNPSLNLVNLIDSNGYTTLHLSVYKNSLTIS